MKLLLRVEMRVMLVLIAGAMGISGIFYVCALINSVVRPWDAAVLGFTGAFFVMAVPAMLIYAPLRALRLRGRLERGGSPGSEL
jgi:hypothetical protein